MNKEYAFIDDILSDYAPGSHGEEWDWVDEAWDLWTREPDYMVKLMKQLGQQGQQRPILLGDDERVWDGHHRLLAAHAMCWRMIEVEYGGRRCREIS